MIRSVYDWDQTRTTIDNPVANHRKPTKRGKPFEQISQCHVVVVFVVIRNENHNLCLTYLI